MQLFLSDTSIPFLMKLKIAKAIRKKTSQGSLDILPERSLLILFCFFSGTATESVPVLLKISNAGFKNLQILFSVNIDCDMFPPSFGMRHFA